MTTRRLGLGLAACALLATLAGCGGSDGSSAADVSAVEVTLNAPGYEPIGTARLAEDGGGTRVTVVLDEATSNVRVDVHESDCLELSTPVVASGGTLRDDGVTELGLPLAELISRPRSLWLHATGDEEESIACGDFGSKPPAPAPAAVAAAVACLEQFHPGPCSEVIHVRTQGRRVHVRLRRPPVYCVVVDLDQWEQIDESYAEGAEEVACPAAVYRSEPKPDVTATLRTLYKKQPNGTVGLSAVDARRTRVVVETYAEYAWIQRGPCQDVPRGPRAIRLSAFFSRRSVTVVPVPLSDLRARPHGVYFYGGLGGGYPLGCALIPPA